MEKRKILPLPGIESRFRSLFVQPISWLPYRLCYPGSRIYVEDLFESFSLEAIPVTGRGGPWGCETSRLPHFLDNRLTGGGEDVNLTRRPLPPRKIVQLEGLGKLKKSNDHPFEWSTIIIQAYSVCAAVSSIEMLWPISRHFFRHSPRDTVKNRIVLNLTEIQEKFCRICSSVLQRILPDGRALDADILNGP
jgi:hypothetical protein